MSYWPELLIESYHLLVEEGNTLINKSSGYFASRAGKRMLAQAEKIKKQMKSLGYYDCWGD
jgi:adenosylmethionine-8-amino-7-oxononanoate aminotransferase